MAEKNPNIEALASDAVDFVNAMCGPDKMLKTEAREFLEIVIDRLETAVEALEEEIENENEDGGSESEDEEEG
jgi:gas vesicle protein